MTENLRDENADPEISMQEAHDFAVVEKITIPAATLKRLEAKLTGAQSCIRHQSWGWNARRDTFGFMSWCRNNEWESMTDDEALAFTEATSS